MKKKSSELSAPGGSFESAYYALSNGADAVYIGLKKYSARKSAKNFDIEQLRRLKTYTNQYNKKIYVAMNTVMTDTDIDDAIETCALLEALDIDGLIVQDIGFSQIVRYYFPGIALHASTQMAIHNSSGIEEIKQLGFKRVILARELSFRNIKKLREIHNDIEIEVFIHGALCYSVSGMCLISGMILGRSGNRGECAQLCRSYYNRDELSEYCFSCNDLALYEKINEYKDIGIDGLKIEGRMKSSEYSSSVVKLYRAILDEEKPYTALNLDIMRKSIRTVFSRGETLAYYKNDSAENLLSQEFPGHKGILIGKAYKVWTTGFFIDLKEDIKVRDGIQYFDENNTKNPMMGSILEIVINGSGHFKAEAGNTVFIKGSITPYNNCNIYKISSRDMDLKKIKDIAFPLYFIPVFVLLSIGKKGFTFTVFFYRDAEKANSEDKINNNKNTKNNTIDSLYMPIVILESHQQMDFNAIVKSVFSESAENIFKISDIIIEYTDGLSSRTVFVPPSQLKKTRKVVYSYINSLWVSNIKKKKEMIFTFAKQSIKSQNDTKFEDDAKKVVFDISLFSKRPSFNPDYLEYDLNDNKSNFISDWNGFKLIQIPPFLYDADEYFLELKKIVTHYSDNLFLFGIQNISHISSYRSVNFPNNCYVFSDFFLYCANEFTYIYLNSLTNCLFIYEYIEKQSIINNFDHVKISKENSSTIRSIPNVSEYFNNNELLVKLVAISKKFHPPLFYSIGCYHKHAVNKGYCDEKCIKKFEYIISEGGRKYSVVINKCITYMIRIS